MKDQGYQEGKGLGKNLQEITEPICPSPKYDKQGLGYFS